MITNSLCHLYFIQLKQNHSFYGEKMTDLTVKKSFTSWITRSM